jgi:ketosteroid isomerase-like protein
MIVKNGFNIMLFVFIMISISIISCQKKVGNTQSGVLLQTDREFSAMSEKEGMFQAFLYNVAEDGVILRDNSYPTKGRNSLIEYYKGKRDTAFILTWEPMFERISKSGDLGYTYGIYTSTVKATGNMTKGTYVSIWQKQADGSWKFILDTGTQGLPESQK